MNMIKSVEEITCSNNIPARFDFKAFTVKQIKAFTVKQNPSLLVN